MEMITLYCDDSEDHKIQLFGSVVNGRPKLKIQVGHHHPAWGSSYIRAELDQKQIKRLLDSLDTE